MHRAKAARPETNMVQYDEARAPKYLGEQRGSRYKSSKRGTEQRQEMMKSERMKPELEQYLYWSSSSGRVD